MSAIDLAILGMVIEQPRSAYAIQKDVLYHNFNRWSKIAKPTIYQNVHKLEAKGYLESEQLPGEKRTNRAVYTITAEGRSYFEKLMKKYAEQQVAFLFDFNIVISNLNKVSKSNGLDLLARLQQNIVSASAVTNENAAKYSDIPLVGRAIFQQQQQLYQVLQNWLIEFRAAYEKEASEFE